MVIALRLKAVFFFLEVTRLNKWFLRNYRKRGGEMYGPE